MPPFPRACVDWPESHHTGKGGNAMNFDIVIVETDEVLLNHGAI
jgi:hypothetical protein